MVVDIVDVVIIGGVVIGFLVVCYFVQCDDFFGCIVVIEVDFSYEICVLVWFVVFIC